MESDLGGSLAMKSWRIAVAGLSLAAACIAGHAAALTSNNIDERDTVYALAFPDLTFSGAYANRSDLLDFHGSVGDSGIFGISGFPPGYTGVSVVPGAGMTVTNQLPANSMGVVQYTAGIVGNSDLTITQSWINHGTVTTGIGAGNLYYLTFTAANTGFLRTGGVFDFVVTMPGNWSTFGTSTGQVHFGGVFPEFSIVQDFVYNASSNLTTFEAIDSSYNQVPTNVQFTLYGAPVPEPQTYALMLMGLLPALVTMRRRTLLRSPEAR